MKTELPAILYVLLFGTMQIIFITQTITLSIFAITQIILIIPTTMMLYVLSFCTIQIILIIGTLIVFADQQEQIIKQRKFLLGTYAIIQNGVSSNKICSSIISELSKLSCDKQPIYCYKQTINKIQMVYHQTKFEETYYSWKKDTTEMLKIIEYATSQRDLKITAIEILQQAEIHCKCSPHIQQHIKTILSNLDKIKVLTLTDLKYYRWNKLNRYNKWILRSYRNSLCD